MNSISTRAAHGVIVTAKGSNGSDGSNGNAGKSGGNILELPMYSYGNITVDGNPSASPTHGQTVTLTGGNGGKGSSNVLYKGGNGGNGGISFGGIVTGSGEIWTHWGSGGGGQGSALSVVQKGGNGGSGGENYLYSGASGGAGGSNNHLMTVTPDFGGWILTSGNLNDGHGLYFQQVGGNGGTGGNGTEHGQGGSGGFAGYAQVGGTSYDWNIATYGLNSHGIFYDSAGGHGGTGGLGDVGDGGKGGTGGLGGLVDFKFDAGANIETGGGSISTGDGSAGILAVSAGGRGGNGGTSNTNTGGTAGTGGMGEQMTVTSGDFIRITTHGANAPAAAFSSIGGDGGSGGPGKVFGSGSNGGKGGAGGPITIGGQWVIGTSGDGSFGLVVSSFGGAGGQGADGSFFGSEGDGGSSGPGGSINVNFDGSLNTQGSEATGIMAQSIAGRGGDGGSSSNAFVAFNASGGSAGDGGPVTVYNPAGIVTGGNQSVGIVAQSIGGGGGHGGQDFGIFYSQGGNGSIGGAGGTVNVTNDGYISTAGNDAHGIQAQSIGGTGGDGGAGASVLVALGGNGGSTSPGGAVKVTNTAAIETGINPPSGQGADPTCGTGCSHGIMAQSIGGGGGNGGSATGWFTVGADGGGGGDGGAVSVINDGSQGLFPDGYASIVTNLDASSGIYAQSVGGGGGYGGGGISVGAGVAVAVGGSGAEGGNGDKVDVVSSHGSQISTHGNTSHGVFAQSVGGGGGGAGYAVSVSASAYPSAAVSVGGTGGKGGNGDTVNVTMLDLSSGGGHNAVTTHGDESRGIVAQSVGGGGGDGGFSVAVTGGGSIASMAFSLGGSGGAAGDGAAANVTSDANITTSGAKSQGILAQSIGGGGGNGGMSIAGAVNLEGAGIAISLGGSGGSGGSSADVTVDNSGTINTAGDEAHGIFGQSTAGGGGNGGLSIAGSVSLGSAGLAVSLGSNGGSGGTSGLSSIQNGTLGQADPALAAITTSGDAAHGIFSQSVGGGGGNGGLSIAGTITDGQGAVAMSLGGSGGAGGDALDSAITNYGNILATGSRSAGLFAQSVGGGGGNGGMSISGTLADSDAKSFSVSLGGSGGGSGNGSSVAAINTGSITTGSLDDPGDPDDSSDNAHGMFAQSVGGGGGNGGFSGAFALGASGESTTANVTISVGGSGGSSGKGGQAEVYHDGNATAYGGNGNQNNGITTYSDQSHAMFAQSIGGSGGNGGSGFAASVEALAAGESSTLNVAIGVGGTAGNGSTGGEAIASHVSGDLETFGAASHGIYAHSVGGSGGSGGSMWTLAYNLKCGSNCESGGNNYNVDVNIGGKGGAGNDGGQVVVDSRDDISTSGHGSFGIYAYSIGGGGGDGGDSSGLPTIPLTDRVSTFKDIGVHVGGSAGSSGNGGDVSVGYQNGAILTLGLNAPGIYAQSVGGGGGRGGTGTGGATGKVTFGGGGGAGGNGGQVDVSVGSGATITTSRSSTGSTSDDIDGSYGIFAQSVGGGGGQAGNAVLFGDHGTGTTDVSIGIGFAWAEPGGNAGNGGAVNVSSDAATIATSSNNGVGIFAQSVGGGGGLAGDVGIGSGTALTGSVVGSVGGDGIGGPVNVESSGDILTFGDGATGIFAQSAGGTAAVTSAGADVTVSVQSGEVTVSGNDASGILVQSVRVSNGDAIGAGSSHVTVASGASVQGGFGGSVQSGAGVEFLDGVANTLVNDGTITSRSGTAVVHKGTGTLSQSGSGSLGVTNTGLIVGDFDMATPGSRVRNMAAGRIDIGSSSRIGGPSGLLLNDGLINIRGYNIVGETNIASSFTQSATGMLAFDLNHVPGPLKGVHADLLIVAGSADLEGAVTIHVRDPGIGGIGRQSVTLIEATGRLTADQLAVSPSAVAQYQLDRKADRIGLSYDIDFTNPAATQGISGNQRKIASHIAAQHAAGGVGAELLFLTEAPNASAYGESLEALSPAPYGVGGAASLMSGMQFADSLLSCKERSGANRFIREADCLRLDGGARHYSQDSTSSTPGFDLSWGGIGLGGQTEVEEGWIIGGGLAYEALNGSSNANLWGSDGDQFHAGIALKRQMGPALLAASLGGGFGSIDVRRQATPGVTANGEQDFVSVSSQFRGAYAFEYTDWYIKPLADLNLTYVSTSSVTETGAGAANLRVDGSDDFYVSVRPAVEFGMELEADSVNGTLFRPRIAVGVTQFLTDPSQSVTATFNGAAPGIAPFTVQNDMDDTSLDIEVGLDVFTRRNVQFSLNGITQISKNSMNIGGSLQLAIAF